ncbi:MAG: RNA polymerase sigma factor [Solirubrobacteraceae bacterium]
MPLALPAPLLRLRSDEQLLALFRSGREDAFRAIHDRYHDRLLAYVRHMLRGSSEAEDVVQDVFLRAYGALRAGEREIAMRPWLYRVAHNRCIDYVRRPPASPLQPDELLPGGIDPVAAAEQREDLRRLVADLHALPDAQRSALIIRELEGLSYDDLAATLDVTVPAVKSLLVRARTGLAEAAEARDTDCAEIRVELALAVDRPGRPRRLLRDHLRECPGCRAHRQALRHGHAQLASLLPGPSSLLLGGWLATLLGSGGGAGSAAAGAGLAAAASKAIAVASASLAVAGGAAEVADHADRPARHHAPAVTAMAAPRVHTITVAARSTPPSVTHAAPAPPQVEIIDTVPSPGPGPVASAPPAEQEEVPTPTPDPTATPLPTSTPAPTETPAPEPTTTPAPAATAEAATEAKAKPTP